MKQKIAIVSGYEQFGYHTDTYNYCLFLKDKFDILYISPDCNLPKIKLDGVSIKYIPYSKIRIFRGIYKILYPVVMISIHRSKLVFINHFERCSLLKKILFNKIHVLDIRTTEISSNSERREAFNNRLKKDIESFENITVISRGVRNLLDIPEDKSHILPLGGKTLINLVTNNKLFQNKISLIYVGTFKERHIEDTIKAFNKFSEKVNGENIEYILIGFFENKEQQDEIYELINMNKYKNIKFLGRIPNEELGKYFESANVGVSYVPITEYFNYQPPTKTYEYLFNGLYTIATATNENKILIKDNINGLLIEDNLESFYKALEQIYFNTPEVTREELIKSVQEYNWENICRDFEKYIDKLINRRII